MQHEEKMSSLSAKATSGQVHKGEDSLRQNSALADYNQHEINLYAKFHFIKNKFLRFLIPPGILTLLTFLFYYPSLNYPFQFDDIANISKRFGIRFDNPLGRWWTSSRWFGDWLNHINYEIGRFEPFYYRLFNVMIHLFAGLLVFYLVRNLCKFLTKQPFLSNNSFFIAFITSGLFLLHPVQTQTVSYVIQARLEGLASMFVVLTLFSYVNVVKARIIASKIINALLLAIAAVLSCGTKELVVVLPALIVLTDWFFISQQEWSSFKKRFLLYGLFSALFMVLVVHHMGVRFLIDALSLKNITGNNRGNILTTGAYDIITPLHFLISEFKVILHYLAIFIWPFNMSVEYDWKLARSFFSFDVISSLVLLVVLLSYVIKCAFHKKYMPFVFGMLWFFIAIAPRATIIPSPELACDYKTYLASVGIMFFLATLVVRGFAMVWGLVRNLSSKLISHELQLGILASLLFISGIFSYQRNKIWETCVAFWEDNAQKAPGKARVHNNLGVALSEAGRIDESIIAYQKAIALDANYADPLSNLAVAYSVKNETDKAIEALRGAIHICPNYPEAYNNLGTLLLQKKQYEDAERTLNIAIQLRPYYGKAYYNMARLFEEKGDLNKAWDFLKKATEGDLDTPEVFFKFGQLCLRVQKYDEAVKTFEKIVAHGVAHDQVWFNLANAHFMLGNHDRAKSMYENLVKNNPLDARYVYNLAETLFTQGNFAHAYDLFRKTTSLPQPVPQAFFRAAHCLEKLNQVDLATAYLQEVLTLNAEEDFKQAVRNELTRISLQAKLDTGKGSIPLGELKKSLALRVDSSKESDQKQEHVCKPAQSSNKEVNKNRTKAA